MSLESKGNENNALSLWIFIMMGLCWPGRISRAAIHPDTYVAYRTYTPKTLPEKNTAQGETGSRSTLPGWMPDSLLLFLEIQANHLQCVLQMNSVRATDHLFNEGIAQTRIVKTQQIWPRSSAILLSSGYCSAPTLRENRGMGPWGLLKPCAPQKETVPQLKRPARGTHQIWKGPGWGPTQGSFENVVKFHIRLSSYTFF